MAKESTVKRRTEVLYLRLTKTEKDQIRSAVGSVGIATWARERLMEVSTDQLPTVPADNSGGEAAKVAKLLIEHCESLRLLEDRLRQIETAMAGTKAGVQAGLVAFEVIKNVVSLDHTSRGLLEILAQDDANEQYEEPESDEGDDDEYWDDDESRDPDE